MTTEPSSFHFRLDKPEHGWMRFIFKVGDDVIDIDASYTPWDSFYEFITALQATYRFGSKNIAHFNEEPTESELAFERSENRLVISLEREDETIELSYDFEKACRKIVYKVRRLISEMGSDEFAREWGHPIPQNRIDELWSDIQSQRA